MVAKQVEELVVAAVEARQAVEVARRVEVVAEAVRQSVEVDKRTVVVVVLLIGPRTIVEDSSKINNNKIRISSRWA